MTVTFTKYYRLPKPDFLSEPWVQEYWDSFDAVDASMYNLSVSAGILQWQNATSYTAGTIVIDPADASTWVCSQSHTSAAVPTTFAEDRAAHTSYWTSVQFSLQARGQWIQGTEYRVGDMVYDTTGGRNTYAVCAVNHVSTATGTITDDAAYWNFTYNSMAPTSAAGIGYDHTTSGLAAVQVQAAIDETNVKKAAVASPAFTGVPTGPTATAGTNTQQLATTAFVAAAVTASTAGVAFWNGRTGSVTMTLGDVTGVGGAPTASPTLTGTPTTTTAAPGTNTTQIASTAFVAAAIAATSGVSPSTTPPLMDSGTTGTVGTGTTYARADHIHPSDTSRVAKAGDTMTGTLVIQPTSGWANFNLNKSAAGLGDAIGGYTNNVLRWQVVPGDSAAETGANAGSNFNVVRYGDSGTLLDTPLSINRATGVTNFAASPSVSGVSVGSGYLIGLTLSTVPPSATFSVAVGAAADSTNTDMLGLTTSATKTTGAWGTANGALDTGTIINSTWYHVYLIKRPDTGVVDVCISVSATGPVFGANIPAAYTKFRRIGSMLTDSSGKWVSFSQLGDDFLWGLIVSDANNVPLVVSGTLRTLTVPKGIQVIASVQVLIITTSLTSISILLTSPDVGPMTAGAGSGRCTAYAYGTSNPGGAGSGRDFVRTNTSGQIYVSASGTGGTYYLNTLGWCDRRGRDG